MILQALDFTSLYPIINTEDESGQDIDNIYIRKLCLLRVFYKKIKFNSINLENNEQMIRWHPMSFEFYRLDLKDGQKDNFGRDRRVNI